MARTMVLCVVAVLSGLAILLAVIVTVRGTDSAAREQVDRTLPAATALRRTWTSATTAQERFLTAAQTRDPIERAAALAGAQTWGQTKDAAWADYLRHALDRPGERALQKSYEESAAQAVTLAASLLAMTPDDPAFAPTLADERAVSARQSAALASMENRFYTPALRRSTSAIVSGIHDARTTVYLTFGVATIIFGALAFWLMRGFHDDGRRMAADAAAMRLEARYSNLETSLQRALGMEREENAAYDVITQALTMVDSEVPSEMLLADSSHAHFRQVLSTDPDADAACRVGSPEECPATMSGQTQHFTNSSSLDTCPFLRGRSDAVWATCVPIGIAGRTTGVLHMQRSVELPPEDTGRGWELIARKAGDRLGMLRAFARSETQAHTDPLTGLLNRRSLETRTRDLAEQGLPFVVAYGDLDHFKLLNDVHGHDSGDRALRRFARTLRDCIRPNDIPARYGGEEFVVVLPDCSIDNALVVIGRVRARLRSELARGNDPEFTVSFGLAASRPGLSFGETVDAADQALLRAKETGRDRVVIAGSATDEVAHQDEDQDQGEDQDQDQGAPPTERADAPSGFSRPGR